MSTMEAERDSPVGEADVPIVEMEAARTEDARREVQLRSPVLDDGAMEEAATPRIHLAGNLLGGTS